MQEKRSLFRTIQNRIGKIFEHLLIILYEMFLTSIIEDKIEGKRGRERPRQSCLVQIKGKVNVVSYQKVNIKVLYRDGRRLLHQREDRSKIGKIIYVRYKGKEI